MWWRVSLVTMTATVFLWAASAALALDKAPLLRDLPQDISPTAVVLYHPTQPDSVTAVDAVGRGGDAGVLAVCVGAGCGASDVAQMAHRRGWTALVAVDPSGDESMRRFGTSSVPTTIGGTAAHLERKLTSSAQPVSLPFASTLASGTSTPATGIPLGPSGVGGDVARVARTAMVVALPLVLVGLGGIVVVGARRRRGEDLADEPRDDFDADEPRDEREQLQWHVNHRHGRKRHLGA